MASSIKWYGKALLNAFGGTTEGESPNIDFLTNTIKLALVTDSYTPDQDTHDFWDDIVANEASGTGYTAGGATLASKTLGYTGATNILKFDAADVAWTITGSLTARYGIIYVSTGNNETSQLIAYIDFEANKTATDDTFTIAFDSAGILKITAA